MMDIVCLGELLIDMFPAEMGRRLAQVSAFRPKPGGAPANVAVAARRLGARSAFIGKVGDDAFGHHLAGVLYAEGVETRGIRYAPQARTTMAFIAMPDENTAEFVFYRNPGADMLLTAEELDRELVAGAKVLHVGSISLIHEPSRGATLEAIRIARRGDVMVSLDVNYRPDLWPSPETARHQIMEAVCLADVVKVNQVELALLTGDADLQSTRHLLECGPSLCVVTLGPEGSFYMLPSGHARVAPFSVKAVDATGCGDAFVAGLLNRLILGDWRSHLTPERMGEILRYANAVGALTSLTVGVIPALPQARDVDAFIAQYSAS